MAVSLFAVTTISAPRIQPGRVSVGPEPENTHRCAEVEAGARRSVTETELLEFPLLSKNTASFLAAGV